MAGGKGEVEKGTRAKTWVTNSTKGREEVKRT
jgi:hypothetical protein